MKKEYSNGEITIVWKPELCIHSANCVNGLPEVFNTTKKPWINIDGAGSSRIVDQVRKCPSGALSIKGDESNQAMDGNELVIAGDRPVLVELEDGKNYAWCACGRSSNQPWCDGSHKVTSITPVVFKAEGKKKAAMCMCKKSANQPFCDGTHNNL
jgi:CDGSH-type Zn-finger protein/uncharacterized Fe-S cluster protein YjdI